MKSPTTLGLVLAVAIGLLIAASPASAVELCKAEEAECSEENTYPAGQSIDASGTSTFTTTVPKFEFKCESLIEGETADEAGNPLPGSISAMQFTSCTSECEVTANTEKGSYYTLLAEDEEGARTLGLYQEAEESPAFHVTCGEAIDCTVGATTMTLNVENGPPVTIEGKSISLEKIEEPGFCPATMTFAASYKINMPEALQIATRSTKLCKTAPGGTGECPAGQGFSGSIETELVGEAKFKSTSGIVSCTETVLTGQNFNEAGRGKINAMTFKSGGICSSTLNQNPGVGVTMLNIPFDSSGFLFRTATKALLVGAREAPLPGVKFKIELPTPQDCTYRSTRFSWIAFAYNPMKIKSNWLAALKTGNPAVCPLTLTLEGELIVKRSSDGGNLWVTK